MFKTRLVSAVFLVIILASMLYFGGPYMLLVLLFISLVGQFELNRALGIITDGKPLNALTIPGYIATIVLYVLMYFQLNDARIETAIIAFLLIVLLGVYVFSFPKYTVNEIVYAFFGYIYVPMMIHYIYMTRNLENGIYFVWLIFLASWICDTGAYCVGMLFGKHRLAPVLSPKKSIEGAIGGVVCSAIAGAVFGIIVRPYMTLRIDPMIVFGIVTAVGSVVSQIGDLAASAIKRNRKIKDYGKLIPGHGGILDRFDSVIFTAPIIYFLMLVLL